MRYIHLIIATSSCFILGILTFCIQQQWIIFLWPHKTQIIEENSTKNTTEQKQNMLYFWKQNKWNKERTTTLWSATQEQNIQLLVNSWFSLAEDEKLLDKDVQVLSVIISSKQEAFISLNKYPFEKNHATYTKLMIIEGILKTLHHSKIQIQAIRLLVHHQPLHDDHLNFHHSWPITGFTKS